MRTPILAILALILASLACGQYITPTPTVSGASDTAAPTHAPRPTATLTALPAPSATANNVVIVRQPVVVVRDTADGVPTGDYITAGQAVIVLEIDGDWVHIAKPDGWVFVGCLEGLSDKGCEAK